MEILPIEIIIEILFYLEDKDKIKLASLNKNQKQKIMNIIIFDNLYDVDKIMDGYMEIKTKQKILGKLRKIKNYSKRIHMSDLSLIEVISVDNDFHPDDIKLIISNIPSSLKVLILNWHFDPKYKSEDKKEKIQMVLKLIPDSISIIKPFI